MVKKTEVVAARVTPEQFKLIKQKAQAIGISVTDYLLNCSLDALESDLQKQTTPHGRQTSRGRK